MIIMESAVISTNQITKIYNEGKKSELYAVKDLNLNIKEGEIYGLLGENGAGKTTTVRILTTMIKATSGTATVFGNDIVSESSDVRKLIGSLPQDSGAYEEFSALENMNFIAQLRGLKDPEKQEKIAQLLHLVGLDDRQHDRVETYSGGMKRRLMIARAMLGDPKILFLDEPTAGIDVLVSRRVREIIKRLSRDQNITVVLSTHDMISAERLCDRVGILHKGVLVAEDTPANIVKQHAGDGGDLEDAVVELIGWKGDMDEVIE